MNGDDRCDNLTRAPRGYLRCQLPLGHEHDPSLSSLDRLHHIDPAGPWYKLVEVETR